MQKGNNIMKNLHMLSFALVVVGAINWGLVGLMDVNLVTMLFGNSPMLVQAVYVAVGVAGLFLVFSHSKDCKVCINK